MITPKLNTYVDRTSAKELAALADSIAARADAMVDRILKGQPAPLGDEARSFGRQAAYAKGVRDVLLWLTGAAPADMLTDVLDITPKGD